MTNKRPHKPLLRLRYERVFGEMLGEWDCFNCRTITDEEWISTILQSIFTVALKYFNTEIV